MTRYPGGSAVAAGWYLDRCSLALVNLPAPGTLPGSGRRSFVRVPLPALILLAPLAGGAWLLAAPVVGLASAAWELVRRAAAAGSNPPRRRPPRRVLRPTSACAPRSSR